MTSKPLGTDRVGEVITADAIVTSTETYAPGWLHIVGDTIAAVGEGLFPSITPASEHITATIVPGFVDMHCHGGGGISFSDVVEHPDAVERVRQTHLQRGTTSLIASLVTATPERLLAEVAALAPHVRAGEIAGIHLEGPWLSDARSGAHDKAQLRHPDPAEIDALLAAAGETVRMVTLAPELPGAIDAIARFVNNDVIVAVGHTDANAEEMDSAFAAGATVATHIFNGMRPPHHQDPGPVYASLANERVTIELILDGHHVSNTAAEVVRLTASSRLALVSDAMSAAGASDGEYALGTHTVHVRDGVARLADGSSLAGSTLTLDRAHQRLRSDHPCSLNDAVRACSTTPSRALRLHEHGDLTAGFTADLAVLDSQGTVIRVMKKGKWIL
ncbi:N-acetylglucosamine-6-phosphate deacetylase [Rhodoglobus sp. NPDC076762]